MKKSLIIYVGSTYLPTIFIYLALILSNQANYDQSSVNTLLILSISFYAVSFFIGIYNLFLGSRLITDPDLMTYKEIMGYKLSLFPYFALNFTFCMLIINTLINPFSFWNFSTTMPIIIILSYFAILPFTILSMFKSAAYMLRYNQMLYLLVFLLVLEAIPILDVISSIIIYLHYQKDKHNEL